MKQLKLLAAHTGFMKYFKNTSWLFAEKIVRMIVGLFIGIWIARYLGPEQFGLLSYVQSSVLLFIAVAKLGLDSIVIKELLQNEKDAKGVILGTAFCLRLAGYVLVFICLNLYILALDVNAEASFLILLFSLNLLFQSFNVIDFYFQSIVKSKYVVYANAGALFIVSCIKIYLLLFDYTIEYFVIAMVIESFFTAAFLLYFYNKKVTKFKYTFNKQEAYTLLKQSWPLIIWGLALQAYMRVDQIMINKYLGNIEVGFYAVAVRLTELWFFLAIIVTNSLFPALINAKSNNAKLYRKRVEKLLQLLVIISISIALLVSLFSEEIVVLLFTQTYAPAADLLTIYAWTIVFVFLNNAIAKWYIIEGLQKLASIRMVFGAVINVILNMVLIPKYGAIGAAYATVFAYFVTSYVINALHKDTRYIFFAETRAILFFWDLRRLVK